MVMVSGMVTSRTSFSLGSSAVCPFSRWTRRRKAATDRSRSSSALSAVTTVSRPRFFCPPPRAGFGAAAGPAACARGLVVVGLERRARAGPCRRNAVLAEALLCLLLGLDLGLEVVFAALLFVGLACFGGLAFGSLGGLAQSADKGFLFRDLALFGFAQPGVVERVHARLLFFLGQAAQHHTAGRLGGRSGSSRGGRRGRCRGGGFGAGGTLGGRRGRGRVGLRARRHAAFHLFDDHRLGAAMAETLAHHALLDPAPFEGQGLARANAELLFASLFRRFSHSNPNSRVSRRISTCSCVARRLGRVAGVTSADTRRTRLRAGPKIVKARGARQERLAFGTGEQGCMYHI